MDFGSVISLIPIARGATAWRTVFDFALALHALVLNPLDHHNPFYSPFGSLDYLLLTGWITRLLLLTVWITRLPSTHSSLVCPQVTFNPCTGAASVIQTVPLYTVIIGVDKGKLSYIAWDDGCVEQTGDIRSSAITSHGTTGA